MNRTRNPSGWRRLTPGGLGLAGPLVGMLLGAAAAAAQPAPSQTQAASANASAQAQLESIRQAIVQAALERPTQVLSTAWIDTNGRLHETAHFQTDAEVRSIRMPSLFTAAASASTPSSAVKIEMLPSAWRQKPKPDQACETGARRLRQPLKIFTELAPGFDGAQSFHGQTLLDESQRLWHEQISGSSRWWPQDYQAQVGGRYQSALTARTSTETAWAVRIGLQTRPSVPSTSERWYQRVGKKLIGANDEQSWAWQLAMTMGTITPSGNFEPLWSEQVPIDVSAQEQLSLAQSWQSNLATRLAPVAAHWAKLLDKAWACEPVQFQVAHVQGDGMTINAGNRSGLNPGDRLLLVAPEYIPRKILENKSMDHLRLAEVVRVGLNQTTIRQLAGPPADGSGRWLALPL